MAKNLKNFKEVTTTFTGWQLLTIIVNCCILDLNSTNPKAGETQRSSKNKQQHSQVEIFTLRWDVMKTAKSRDCYATVCWCFSECSRECCLDIFVEVAPVTSPCFLRFLQPLMTPHDLIEGLVKINFLNLTGPLLAVRFVICCSEHFVCDLGHENFEWRRRAKSNTAKGLSKKDEM